MANMVLGTETERKFLVREGWPRHAPAKLIRQGYFPAAPGITMRVRWTEAYGMVTMKTPVLAGTRWEAEYPITSLQAAELLQLCAHQPIEKLRHEWQADGITWEIDEFLGRHAGLCLAEVELVHPWQDFSRPGWLGEDVTDVKAFHNSTIARTASVMEILSLWHKAAKSKGVSRAPDIFPTSEVPRRLHDVSGIGQVLHRRYSL